jgi:FMN reductase
MSQKSILLISGSPSQASRSTRLLDEIGARLGRAGIRGRRFSAADFEPHELLNPTSETENIRELVSAARTASGIVVSTPVYKGTFSGVLKVVIDLIPPDALTGKVGLGIATARIAEQLPETASAIAGVFRFFKIGQIVEALTFTDEQLKSEPAAPLPESIQEQLEERTVELLSGLRRIA